MSNRLVLQQKIIPVQFDFQIKSKKWQTHQANAWAQINDQVQFYVTNVRSLDVLFLNLNQSNILKSKLDLKLENHSKLDHA